MSLRRLLKIEITDTSLTNANKQNKFLVQMNLWLGKMNVYLFVSRWNRVDRDVSTAILLVFIRR